MRNYVKLWTARGTQGGNFTSFVGETEADVNAQIDAWFAFWQAFGGVIDWRGKAAYILLDKKNLVSGLMKSWVAHYPAAFGSQFTFLQDGLFPTESPRQDWSHGE